MTTQHDALLAQAEAAEKDSIVAGYPAVTKLIVDLAAAIRAQAKEIEAERKAREQLIEDFDLLANDANALAEYKQRAEAAVAKVKAMAQRFQQQGDECLARTREAEAKIAAVEAETLVLLDRIGQVEADTIERCAKTSVTNCNKCGGAGWLRGAELDDADADTQADSLTRYSCDGNGCKTAAAIRALNQSAAACICTDTTQCDYCRKLDAENIRALNRIAAAQDTDTGTAKATPAPAAASQDKYEDFHPKELVATTALNIGNAPAPANIYSLESSIAAFVQRADLPPQPETILTTTPRSKSQYKRLVTQGAIPATTDEPEVRNYPEDYKFENGSYWNTCIACKKQFLGYKRRQLCKLCYLPLSATDWRTMTVSELAAGNPSLKAYSDELESKSRDAARYRWLRSGLAIVEAVEQKRMAKEPFCIIPTENASLPLYGDELDAAIDAVIDK